MFPEDWFYYTFQEQVVLVIRGLFICGSLIRGPKKKLFLKNQSFSCSIVMVFLFAVQNKKKVSTANNEGNLYYKYIIERFCAFNFA